ncbi:MAG: hypothetical protein GEU90_02195 [Gemmatimonas sp.]|nr:hypothetical protein [Gemmatimonas sp.]
MPYNLDDQLYPVRREPKSFWEKTGLTGTQRRVLDVFLAVLLFLLTIGWGYAAADAIYRGDSPTVGQQIAGGGSPFSAAAPAEATFAMDALLQQLIDWEEVRGESGEVQVLFQEPGDTVTLPADAPDDLAVEFGAPGDTASDPESVGGRLPDRAGVWNMLLRMGSVVRQVPQLNVVTLTSATEITSGRIGRYEIGNWPAGEGAYAPPTGFVEVTPENMETYVSTHFQLKDFLTKGQEGVWPKYAALSPRLLDKLELTLQELERRGHPVENVFVVSGFRTPVYNEGGGNPQGRGALSRHMYGDAADIAIDNDGDGCMDDLTGDGRADRDDVEVVAQAAEQVEKDYPHLIGGIGRYRPVPGSHCGMVHIDARGNRARW